MELFAYSSPRKRVTACLSYEHLTLHQLPTDKPLLYNFHVRRWEVYHTLFIQMYAAPILRLILKPQTNIGALFYPETVKQTTSNSSTYTFNPTRTIIRNT